MGRRRSEAVTLADVARLAGVSIATASKAINDRDEVAAATRARVLRAATELSFQPNALARSLTSGTTRAIGLLTDDLGGRFAMPILLAAENALANEEMSVLLCDARGDPVRRRQHIRTLLARQVDGFLIVGHSNDIRPSVTADIPVPVVYAYCQSADPADLCLVSDDAGGARLAIEHLISLRRRHIAHITGPQGYQAARVRAVTVRQVLAEHGLPLAGGEPRYGEWSQRWGRQAARELVTDTQDVDAVFCGNDQIAAGVTQVLPELGLRVPEDVAVVGYDNWEIFAEDGDPSLTTIDLDLPQLGTAAVRHLLAALRGAPATGAVRHPGRLVVRESTARAPAGLLVSPGTPPPPRTPAPCRRGGCRC
ncbi:LacI family transcriptional regulator [Crossiella sp. SN42]|uniref:LacI family DNA-binding transcriptional regulator n=1 Tax=Crossiella sp. SN42 TaxID=2944808 RepID=UPI00207D0DCF|nr:LacI family DNA-binding transcriptional regulator [Crossiella sp. SN42]MCO1577359.1 LacI family transcriptional regulator [Crossiella sp. SN42]